MLVISRSIQQSVLLGEFDGLESVLKVTVIEVHAGEVRLGFDLLSNDALSHKPMHEPVCIVHRPTRPQRREPATTGAVDRWNDDGGGSNVPAYVPELEPEPAPSPTGESP